MFDHIMLKVKDLKASKRFYSAALAPLGFSVQYDADGMVGFGPKDAPALWLAKGETNGPVHVAFAAKDRAAVKAFYDAAAARGRQGQWQARPPSPVFRQLLRRLREGSRRQQYRGRLPSGRIAKPRDCLDRSHRSRQSLQFLSRRVL